MAGGPNGVTRAQHVYDRLRTAILSGGHPPGSSLRLQALSEEFAVSMSVVREALTKLAERHLVTTSPNIGFRVVELSREDLLDLLDIRVQVEGMALTRSIEHGDVDWAAHVISTHYVLEHTPLRREREPGTTDEWSIAHERFHDALGVACGSRRLLAYTRMLRDSAEVYRQLSGARDHDDRDVAGEHRRLMELATTRRVEAARAALADHLSRTAQQLLDGVFAPRVDQGG